MTEIGTLDFNFKDEVPVEEQKEVVFRFNSGPQETFLKAPQQQVLYGGAAGAGKSYALLADAAAGFVHPQFRGLLVRRTNDELRELIQKSQELYPKAFPGAKWSKQASEWVMPNGSRLWMSYLERDDDVMRYHGQSFTWIGFDELTQWPTPFAWNFLSSRLRTTAPDLPLYQRASTNPGSVGHLWVKKMFIDPAPWGQAFWATDIDTGETLVYPPDHSKAGQPLFKRRFIPGRLADNPYLAADGQYEMQLLSLPEIQRKQLLYGDWDVAVGAAFPEWNRKHHVIEPFDIPRDWVKFRACDYGYGSKAAVLWFAVSPNDQLIVYRELYVSKVLARDLSYMVQNLEREDGTIYYGVLDSSLWAKRGDAGPSLAEQMIAAGSKWRPSDRSKGSRIAGKNEIHSRLAIDEYTDMPGLVFFNTCTESIAQLPTIPLDKDNPEDVDTKAEDHIYDALRYGIMTRPRSHLWHDNRTTKQWQPADRLFGY